MKISRKINTDALARTVGKFERYRRFIAIIGREMAIGVPASIALTFFMTPVVMWRSGVWDLVVVWCMLVIASLLWMAVFGLPGLVVNSLRIKTVCAEKSISVAAFVMLSASERAETGYRTLLSSPKSREREF
ncbi:MAG: hypothetical protein IID51_03695 [Proteobacteria bacterium]|nr:hypothetical protein [Pseudomonadota bacterium]